MISVKALEQTSWECVHFVRSGELSDLLPQIEKTSLRRIVIDVSSVHDEMDLFASIAYAFEFPEYFGNNWDAMDECLSDLEWLPGNGFVLVLTGAKEVWREAPLVLGRLISLWQSISEEWRDQDKPFHIIFSI